MTIQRQYNLPNCTLVLEGLSDAALAPNPADLRPLMTILLNAECYLGGGEKPLSGGREFFESLVRSVSLYAQEILSGIHLPTQLPSSSPNLVQLQQVNFNLHRLSIQPHPETNPAPSAGVQVVDLTTVQLFDLVEAVDQFLADSQTLPNLSVPLAPVPKRFVAPGQSLSKQAVPAAIGISTAAVAAVACFMLPVPKVRQPDCVVFDPRCAPTVPTNRPTGASPGAASPSPSPSASPSPQSQASPSASPVAETSPSPAAAADQPDLAQLEAALSAAPEIVDPGQLEGIGQKLYASVDKQWSPRIPFDQELVYRVSATKDGTIVGYKPVNDAAARLMEQVPLRNLLYVPPAGQASTQEPIGQFRVVFTTGSRLEVKPWRGSEATTGTVIPTNPIAEITNPDQIRALQPKLYEQIDQRWKGTPPFNDALIYRVRVRQDGTVVDYEPINQTAIDHSVDTPLPNLGKPVRPGNAPEVREPLALFKVVFQPSGVLQISPWRGRRD